jgi:hypothetical protein
MANKPDDFPKFTKIDKSTIDYLLNKFSGYLSDFSEKTGLSLRRASPAVSLRVVLVLTEARYVSKFIIRSVLIPKPL